MLWIILLVKESDVGRYLFVAKLDEWVFMAVELILHVFFEG